MEMKSKIEKTKSTICEFDNFYYLEYINSKLNFT